VECHRLITPFLYKFFDALIRGCKKLLACAICEFTLLGDHLIELKKSCSCLFEELLDGCLHAVKSAVHNGTLQRHLVTKAEPVHETLNPVTTKDAEYVILKGNEEASSARVALPACSPTELVIDAPRFMPSCTKHIEPTTLDDLVTLIRESVLE